MTEGDNAPVNPDPPHSPGTPRLDGLDVRAPDVERTAPTGQDVSHDAAAAEPPD
ncbi:hypothetical protein [Saccharothrix luteola]|uniref:hypothetical protein n=1 Tax=Saccharothrix luteola TaxID=2893018 RepID=UPI001E5FDAE1|nr:hypothetical protein [Saccharothrix luteola]MCC8247673.1 hypothetical protein [Saccharothrix luteola]